MTEGREWVHSFIPLPAFVPCYSCRWQCHLSTLTSFAPGETRLRSCHFRISVSCLKSTTVKSLTYSTVGENDANSFSAICVFLVCARALKELPSTAMKQHASIATVNSTFPHAHSNDRKRESFFSSDHSRANKLKTSFLGVTRFYKLICYSSARLKPLPTCSQLKGIVLPFLQ